jgi:hypothetical protein
MYSVLPFISACVRATAARYVPVDAPVRPISRLLSEPYFALHGEMNSTIGTKTNYCQFKLPSFYVTLLIAAVIGNRAIIAASCR